MGKNITRAQFEALNCELIEQDREGGGAMGINAMDVYLAPGGQTVIHTWVLTDWWPEAQNVEREFPVVLEFTDRFPEPSWWIA